MLNHPTNLEQTPRTSNPNQMIDNIIFAGGIHGAGKGTICKELSQSFKFNHLSASEVLKCGMSSFVGTISTKFVIEEHL